MLSSRRPLAFGTIQSFSLQPVKFSLGNGVPVTSWYRNSHYSPSLSHRTNRPMKFWMHNTRIHSSTKQTSSLGCCEISNAAAIESATRNDVDIWPADRRRRRHHIDCPSEPVQYHLVRVRDVVVHVRVAASALRWSWAPLHDPGSIINIRKHKLKERVLDCCSFLFLFQIVSFTIIII
jgi:hypothetical protein